jgi:hypothetical protein
MNTEIGHLLDYSIILLLRGYAILRDDFAWIRYGAWDLLDTSFAWMITERPWEKVREKR